ncbi:MAG TPA: hypothetical protein VMY78_15765 [Solirubrobacteraceae bacterium]|nr:hypothetical protein [Solirubrobacteraceae bacterium]
MLRSSRLAIAASVAALAALFGAPSAGAAASCGLRGADARPPDGRPTYNMTLQQTKTRCTTARKVMKAFHACRSPQEAGCSRKVLTNWACTGRKTSSIPTLFYGTFTCKWGSRRVTGTYQQNTPS